MFVHKFIQILRYLSSIRIQFWMLDNWLRIFENWIINVFMLMAGVLTRGLNLIGILGSSFDKFKLLRGSWSKFFLRIWILMEFRAEFEKIRALEEALEQIFHLIMNFWLEDIKQSLWSPLSEEKGQKAMQRSIQKPKKPFKRNNSDLSPHTIEKTIILEKCLNKFIVYRL